MKSMYYKLNIVLYLWLSPYYSDDEKARDENRWELNIFLLFHKNI